MAEENNFDYPSEDLGIDNIPDEILLEIFRKLDFEDLCRCSGLVKIIKFQLTFVYYSLILAHILRLTTII